MFKRILLGLLIFASCILLLIHLGLYLAAKKVEDNPKNQKLSKESISKRLEEAIQDIPFLEENVVKEEASGYKVIKTFHIIPYKTSSFEARYVPAIIKLYYNHQLTWDEAESLHISLGNKGIQLTDYKKDSLQLGYLAKDLASQTATDAVNFTYTKECIQYELSGASFGRRDLPSGYRMSFSVTEGDVVLGSC